MFPAEQWIFPSSYLAELHPPVCNGISAIRQTSVWLASLAGGSTTGGGKTLNCSGNTCLDFGFNTNTFADGIVAVATFQIAANPSTTSIGVIVNGVVASTAAGTPIPASGGGAGIITLPTPVALSAVGCTTTTLNTPTSTGCTVSLTGAAPGGGFAVPLSSNNANLTVPASVTVGAGLTTAGFTATAAQVSTNQSAMVTASTGGVTKTVTLNLVAPVQPASLSCSPATVNAPGTSSCTVTLTAAAPARWRYRDIVQQQRQHYRSRQRRCCRGTNQRFFYRYRGEHQFESDSTAHGFFERRIANFHAYGECAGAAFFGVLLAFVVGKQRVQHLHGFVE